MKKCTKCGIEKSLLDFHKHINGKDGLHSYCKRCYTEQIKLYYRTKKGLLTKIYGDQRKSSIKRGYPMPIYTKEELVSWFWKQNNAESLYKNWKESGYKKDLIPSIDRLDDYKGYYFDNIQLMTWKENNSKSHLDMKNGINNKQNKAIIGVYKITGEEVKFYSLMEAERITGIYQGNISKCCNGKVKSAGGYVWNFNN